MSAEVYAAALRKLARLIPRCAPDFDKEDTITEWCVALKDIPMRALGKAAEELVRTSAYFPSIVEIRQAAGHGQLDSNAVVTRSATLLLATLCAGKSPYQLRDPLALAMLTESGLSECYRDLDVSQLNTWSRRLENIGRLRMTEARMGKHRDSKALLALMSHDPELAPRLELAPTPVINERLATHEEKMAALARLKQQHGVA